MSVYLTVCLSVFVSVYLCEYFIIYSYFFQLVFYFSMIRVTYFIYFIRADYYVLYIILCFQINVGGIYWYNNEQKKLIIIPTHFAKTFILGRIIVPVIVISEHVKLPKQCAFLL